MIRRSDQTSVTASEEWDAEVAYIVDMEPQYVVWGTEDGELWSARIDDGKLVRGRLSRQLKKETQEFFVKLSQQSEGLLWKSFVQGQSLYLIGCLGGDGTLEPTTIQILRLGKNNAELQNLAEIKEEEGSMVQFLYHTKEQAFFASTSNITGENPDDIWAVDLETGAQTPYLEDYPAYFRAKCTELLQDEEQSRLIKSASLPPLDDADVKIEQEYRKMAQTGEGRVVLAGRYCSVSLIPKGGLGAEWVYDCLEQKSVGFFVYEPGFYSLQMQGEFGYYTGRDGKLYLLYPDGTEKIYEYETRIYGDIVFVKDGFYAKVNKVEGETVYTDWEYFDLE